MTLHKTKLWMFLLHYYIVVIKKLYSRTYRISSAKWRSTSDKSCFEESRRSVTKQLLCTSADAWILGLRVRILLRAWIFVCCVWFCVCRGLRGEVIFRSKDHYWACLGPIWAAVPEQNKNAVFVQRINWHILLPCLKQANIFILRFLKCKYVSNNIPVWIKIPWLKSIVIYRILP